MGHRLTKIYTRTGDKGATGLSDGNRVEKDSPRIEAMGDVDELNAAVGMVVVHDIREPIRDCLYDVQHKLFDIGGEISLPGYRMIRTEDVTALEMRLDSFNAGLPPLKDFILPSGGPASTSCHLARAICRRAERRLVTLGRAEDINLNSLAYLNRLSDLLFVMCRILARDEGGVEVLWRHERKGPEGPEQR